MLMLMPGGAVKMYMHRVEIFGFFSDAGDNDTVSSANEVIRFGSCWLGIPGILWKENIWRFIHLSFVMILLVIHPVVTFCKQSI